MLTARHPGAPDSPRPPRRGSIIPGSPRPSRPPIPVCASSAIPTGASPARTTRAGGPPSNSPQPAEPPSPCIHRRPKAPPARLDDARTRMATHRPCSTRPPASPCARVPLSRTATGTGGAAGSGCGSARPRSAPATCPSTRARRYVTVENVGRRRWGTLQDMYGPLLVIDLHDRRCAKPKDLLPPVGPAGRRENPNEPAVTASPGEDSP